MNSKRLFVLAILMKVATSYQPAVSESGNFIEPQKFQSQFGTRVGQRIGRKISVRPP